MPGRINRSDGSRFPELNGSAMVELFVCRATLEACLVALAMWGPDGGWSHSQPAAKVQFGCLEHWMELLGFHPAQRKPCCPAPLSSESAGPVSFAASGKGPCSPG